MTVSSPHSPVRFWRLLAGIESTRPLMISRLPRIYEWTVPPRSRRGDIAVIYTTGAVQSYVAIARICCDPREGADERHWSWLQCQPLAHPTPQLAVRALPGTQRPGTGLNTPAGSSFNEMYAGAQRDLFLRHLVDDDEKAAARLAAWSMREGAWPRYIDCEDLADAQWAPPEATRRGELLLAQRIAEHLVRRGKARYLTDGDIYQRWLEVELVFDDRSWGRADIILVSLVHDAPTLLLIEVKLDALPRPGRNPIDQLITYLPAVKRDAGRRWRVLPWAIAQDFHPAVLAQARSERVACSRCSSQGRSITSLDGRSPTDA